ncbi:hypothetical protein KAU09_01315 [Candidatus Parcubacteria bacterium]|nr:hypothetical protein [Candidatus Parcubacteria bacterium]
MRVEDFIMTNGRISVGKTVSWIMVVVFCLIVVVNAASLVERNTSGIYQVNQGWWDGDITTRFEPGFYYQGLALIDDFKAAASYKFSDKPDAENVSAPPFIVRFNDGGRAKVYGGARFVLPRSNEDMKHIKLIFNNQQRLEQELYSQVVKEAVVMTAALMSSEESYSSLRTQFSTWAGDQVKNGIYIVEKKTREVFSEDDQDKMVIQEYVDIKTYKNDHGQEIPVRKEVVLAKFGIDLQQFIIEDIVYLDGLDKLIDKKRGFLTKIIEVKSAGEKAVQEKKTAISDGEKMIAEAKYVKLQEKEKIVLDLQKKKEQAIIAANRDLSVAMENKQTALNKKQQWIAKGKGKAEKRRLALLADGALSMKKNYYIHAWEAYQTAFSSAQLVPGVITSKLAQNSNELPGGVNVLFQIEQQLRKELGLDLVFD